MVALGTTGKSALVAGLGLTTAGLMGASEFGESKRGASPLPALIGGTAALGLAAAFAVPGVRLARIGDFGVLGVAAMIGGTGVGAIGGSLLGAHHVV